MFFHPGSSDADLKQTNAILTIRIISILDEQQVSVTMASKPTRRSVVDICNADNERFTLECLVRIWRKLDDNSRSTLQVEMGESEGIGLANSCWGIE